MFAAWVLSLVSLVAVQEPAEEPVLTTGPVLGHAGPTEVWIWARVRVEGEYELHYLSGDPPERVVRAIASPENDLTLRWHLTDLEPGTEYPYYVAQHYGGPDDHLIDGLGGYFYTAPNDDANEVRIAFGSCANEKRFPHQAAWDRMIESGAEAIVLLGDTPYIDSTDLAVQRRRYREFFAVPEVLAALSEVPLYATWDDHDFGRNDTDGTLAGKENARRAFLEYHAGPAFGENGEGIYSSFRRGPLEVFLLDARWFAGTAPSPVAPDEKTLLGEAQWAWLKRGLRRSTAPFKILATGMVWNGAVRPRKTDHWLSYPGEREALFRFIGEAKIPGVILVGGDIHRTRALRHRTEDLAGYDLFELITSPLANTVIDSANQETPLLLFDAGVQETFLLVEVTRRTLVARFLEASGEELFQLEVAADDLR